MVELKKGVLPCEGVGYSLELPRLMVLCGEEAYTVELPSSLLLCEVEAYSADEARRAAVASREGEILGKPEEVLVPGVD